MKLEDRHHSLFQIFPQPSSLPVGDPCKYFLHKIESFNYKSLRSFLLLLLSISHIEFIVFVVIMASETETPEMSSLFERLWRHRDMSLFLPFILGLTGNITTRENPRSAENPDQPTANPSERIILINPFTQGMVVIDGASNLDSLFRNLAAKDGQPPASKASVEAMPSFVIDEREHNQEVGECVVCLEEYEAGEIAKEMPCKHRFHAQCIEKWLGIHGSCPVCRYKMPVDEEEIGSKVDEQRREIWVSFSLNSSRRGGGDSDSNQNETTTSSSDAGDVSSSPSPRQDQEMEN